MLSIRDALEALALIELGRSGISIPRFQHVLEHLRQGPMEDDSGLLLVWRDGRDIFVPEGGDVRPAVDRQVCVALLNISELRASVLELAYKGNGRA